MSLRILFLNRSFYPDISATGQLLTELCEDLVNLYHCQVTVISGRPMVRRDDYPDDNFLKAIFRTEHYNGIEILRVRNTVFSPKSFLGRISNYLTYFSLSFIAALKIKKPDLVMTLTDPPIIGLTGLWLSFRFNIPFVLSVRDIFPEVAQSLEGSENKIINFFLDGIVRFCFRKSTHIVALGQMMQRRIIEKGAGQDKISIIPDWADCANISPVSKRNAFALLHNLADYFVVMYAGNIGASSGLEVAIESSRLLKEYRDIIFVFVGEGILKEKLINLAKRYQLESTMFLPFQPREELSAVFSSADIFIIPLKKGLSGYSVPSKIYAIMASGRPYVACVEEESETAVITKESNCGLLAKPQDYEDLASKILIFYNNKELRARMGENARKAAAPFDRRRGVNNYYELFKKLLQVKETI